MAEEPDDDIWGMLDDEKNPLEEMLSGINPPVLYDVLQCETLIQEVAEGYEPLMEFLSSEEVLGEIMDILFIKSKAIEEMSEEERTNYVFKFPYIASQVFVVNSPDVKNILFNEKSVVLANFFKNLLSLDYKKSQVVKLNPNAWNYFHTLIDYFFDDHYDLCLKMILKLLETGQLAEDQFLVNLLAFPRFSEFFAEIFKANMDRPEEEKEASEDDDFFNFKEPLDKKSCERKRRMNRKVAKKCDARDSFTKTVCGEKYRLIQKLIQHIVAGVDVMCEEGSKSKVPDNFDELEVCDGISNLFQIFGGVVKFRKNLSSMYTELTVAIPTLVDLVFRKSLTSRSARIRSFLAVDGMKFFMGMLQAYRQARMLHHTTEGGDPDVNGLDSTLVDSEFLFDLLKNWNMEKMLDGGGAEGKDFNEHFCQCAQLINVVMTSMTKEEVLNFSRANLNVFAKLFALNEMFPTNNILHFNIYQTFLKYFEVVVHVAEKSFLEDFAKKCNIVPIIRKLIEEGSHFRGFYFKYVVMLNSCDILKEFDEEGKMSKQSEVQLKREREKLGNDDFKEKTSLYREKDGPSVSDGPTGFD